jgi:hypothetical protein
MLRYSHILPITVALLLSACKGGDEDTGEPNTVPEAHAGEDQTVAANETVSLSGAASFDQDGDELSFHWSFEHLPEGSSLGEMEMPFSANATAEAVDTTFSPDAVGTFVVNLTVSDGRAESNVDFLIVNTETPSLLPTAMAGDDTSGEVGATIALDGSASFDPEGRSLSYNWSLVQKPSDSTLSALTDAATVAASFSPDARGVYIFNLVVNNGLTDSAPDSVIVTATGDDSAPVASAGEDQVAEDCSHLQLDGSASVDPDSDPLQYYWELQSKPTGSVASNDNFSDRHAESPSFWADWAGDYVLSLTVTDGANWSLADMVNLTLSERATNTPPIVNISTLATVSGGETDCVEDGYVYDCDDCDDQTVEMGPNVTINDPDNDPYTVKWEMTSGSGIVASPYSVTTNVKLENIEATEPNVCDTNEWVLELTVTDCTTASTTKSTTVTVDCCGVESTSTSTSSN